MTDQTLRRTETLPAQAAGLAALMEPALRELAGPGSAPVSIAIDYGVAAAPGDTLQLEASVERMTRTLVFANVRLLTDAGALAANASAVFRRNPQAETSA